MLAVYVNDPQIVSDGQGVDILPVAIVVEPPGFGESVVEPPGCVVIVTRKTVNTMMTTTTMTATNVLPMAFLRVVTSPSIHEASFD